MPQVEIRVLSGARSGFRACFTQPTITIGRQPGSDLQLDPGADLDVSGRHAEIVVAGGAYEVRDLGSRNGTFVNGARIIPGSAQRLREGDVIALGSEGPRIEIAGLGTRDSGLGTGGAGLGARSSTAERVRVAVRAEMARTRRLLAASAIVLCGGIAAAYWAGHREPREATAAMPTATPRPQSVVQQAPAPLDLSAISARNDSAVAFLVSELDGKPFGGTAFGVTPAGLLVTNRHNVRSDRGRPPTRLGVKFANTNVWLRAHVVRVNEDPAVDLALVQVDEPGHYPVVAGIAPSTRVLRAGAPVATIGFPEALDTPMQGDVVKTSLASGTLSKLLPNVLQIDSYATHGSSGTPVFDMAGEVVGVIWGGEPASAGRIVYAVPSDLLVPMLPDEARRIVR